MAGTRKDIRAEDIVWNGRVYRRQPGHPDRHRRVYFMATTAPRNYLHRDIYVETFGPLAPNLDVHHIDHDPNNNSPGNLMAISRSAHLRRHGAERPDIEKRCDECGMGFLAKLERARWCSPACKERRRRKDGVAFVRSRPGPFRDQRICVECGTEYVAKRPWATYCSGKCRGIAGRRSRQA